MRPRLGFGLEEIHYLPNNCYFSLKKPHYLSDRLAEHLWSFVILFFFSVFFYRIEQKIIRIQLFFKQLCNFKHRLDCFSFCYFNLTRCNLIFSPKTKRTAMQKV